jgi:hypothetical protein
MKIERFCSARLDTLGRCLRAAPGSRRAVTLARSGRVLFLHAAAPPVPGSVTPGQPAAEADVPGTSAV